MSVSRENAAWAGCGGPTTYAETFHADGFTIDSDRRARLHIREVKAGDYRRRGNLWFRTAEAARGWLAQTYPSLYS